MAGNASDYTESKIINHLMRSATWAKTTARWISLHTESPYDDATGTEVSGGSYARQQLDASDTNWSEEGSSPYTLGVCKNLVAITYPSPTADWGHITNFGVWDDPTAGNLLWYGALDTPVDVLNGGAAPTFDVETIVLTVG